ncbi:MAG TPA: hypothetical protein VJ862_03520 [Rhodanobacteraceae bacterium]|nr:hypothetical protein [Rhodanobacteraceae bacterium]
MQDEAVSQNADAGMTDAGRAAKTPGLTVDRLLVWIAVFAIVTSLVGLATSLAGVFHAPQVLLISLVLTILYARQAGAGATALPGLAPQWAHVVLLILVALIFRLPAYHYVLGGQDEGTYVNVAHYINDTGGIAVHDRTKQELEGSPFLDNYIAENQIAGGTYLAGVYKRSYKNGKLEFQFYHVFPVWMALFDGILGSAAGVYALTFFAIISIILFYRLALLLTGSHRAGLAAGGLLALNPLHAFFSKFPVTEVPTLCFALIGFLFLAAYWPAAPESRPHKGWLFVSVLAFLCVFTTRISGFMYVPFFIALAWAALIFDSDRARCRALRFWAVGVTGAYLFSVVYGLVWSHSYAHDIYRLSFAPLLGTYWKAALAVACALFAVVWVSLTWMVRNESLRARLARWFERPRDWVPTIVVWGALLLGLVKIYRLAWTSRYVSDPWLGTMWRVADVGRTSVEASSLWTLVVFLGPFLVLAFLLLATIRKHEPRIAFLFWFVAGFFAYILLLQWVVPYVPYYSRYLLSELAPYTILFVVCVWSGLRPNMPRKLLTVAIAVSALYAAGLSAAQIGKNEYEGAYTELARAIAPVGPSDMVLLYLQPNSPFDQDQIKTPLLYTFHRQTVTVSTSDLTDAAYLAKLDSLCNNVFLLTEGGGYAPAGFELVASTQFNIRRYQWNHTYPRKLGPPSDVVLNLYRMEHPRLPEGTPLGFATNGVAVGWLESGWSAPEGWGTWSSGKQAILRIDLRGLPDGHAPLALHVDAQAFVGPRYPVQRISVEVNGEPAGQYVVRYPNKDFSMHIPLGQVDAESARMIRVVFDLPDAQSPRSLGVSSDMRNLALGLVSVSIGPSRQRDQETPHATKAKTANP